MARVPALTRWARRPGPLLVDAVLAVVLLAISLSTIETGGGPSEQALRYDVPPAQLEPGEVWETEITAPGNGAALRPIVLIQNTATGEWTTIRTTPTNEPGVYRARVVFPEKGVYGYDVRGGFEGRSTAVPHLTTVEVGGATAPPSTAPADSEAPDPWQLVLTVLATLPVALRRRQPVPVLAVTLIAAVAADVAYDTFPFAGALVALYTVAVHVGRPASIVAAAGAAAALSVLFLRPGGLGAWESVAIYAFFGAAWLLGDNVRTRRERAARLEAEHEANVGRAAAEEQARMARELHDIIGHSVSVMTIQAAAAGDAFDSRPAQVREALRAIESTGRETLSELRRLLGGVRPDDARFAPAPGLESLAGLVERVRAAGLAVDLHADGGPDALPPSVDLSAYRIVQEALTNTLKHARASKAWVEVRQVNGALEIEVVDDGHGRSAEGTGRGIVGMRERAAQFGGDLEAGPAPGGGFAVHARIPLEEPVA